MLRGGMQLGTLLPAAGEVQLLHLEHLLSLLWLGARCKPSAAGRACFFRANS